MSQRAEACRSCRAAHGLHTPISAPTCTSGSGCIMRRMTSSLPRSSVTMPRPVGGWREGSLVGCVAHVERRLWTGAAGVRPAAQSRCRALSEGGGRQPQGSWLRHERCCVVAHGAHALIRHWGSLARAVARRSYECPNDRGRLPRVAATVQGSIARHAYRVRWHCE